MLISAFCSSSFSVCGYRFKIKLFKFICLGLSGRHNICHSLLCLYNVCQHSNDVSEKWVISRRTAWAYQRAPCVSMSSERWASVGRDGLRSMCFLVLSAPQVTPTITHNDDSSLFTERLRWNESQSEPKQSRLAEILLPVLSRWTTFKYL